MAAAETLAAQIRDKALALDFAAVGFAPAELGPESGMRLQEFLAAGWHGEMGWMESRAEQRAAPRALWAAAKSIIVVGLSYLPEGDPLAGLARLDTGNISVYARGR
ncbi:MAG: QueG-associated DUF1730 domain-containing protein, partial [Acetobacteraceae bacterium]